ncbi:MAG: hypothetical protein ACRCUT_02960 [Spirochaetota bacterium]
MLSELMEQYDDLIPDLAEIKGLDLNWDQLFDCCNEEYPYPNFGLDDLYSIGTDGHDYLVFCPQVNTPVDKYPIAVFNEESGTSRIISSSIKNWFPCYLTVRTDALLAAYVQENSDGEQNGEAAKALAGMLKSRTKIEKFAEEFGNKKFMAVLPEIFDAIRDKVDPDGAAWNFTALYQAAEGSSYVSEAIALEKDGASPAGIRAFIDKYPFYNRGVYLLFRDKDLCAVADKSPEEFFPLLDDELAIRILSSTVTADMGDKDDISRILKAAAYFLRQNESYEQSPFAGLIDELYDNDDPCIAHMYYEAGLEYANDGDIARALSCYENAIFFSWIEEESFYSDAFDEIRFLAPEFKDKNYADFIKALRYVDDEAGETGEGEDEEEDDEPDFDIDIEEEEEDKDDK